jgi:hypothetical protein
MANRLTRGEALVGALSVDAGISAAEINATDVNAAEISASGDINVGDDVYVTGALGKGVAVANITDGAAMAFTAAQLLGGIITATPTEARDLQAPTAAALVAAVDAGNDVGLGFEFTVINLAPATHGLTLTVNTGTTIIGSPAVAAASSASFVARIASGTAVVIYRK